MSLLRRLEHAASGRYGTEQASTSTRAPDPQVPDESIEANSAPTIAEPASKQEAVPQALSKEAAAQELPEVYRSEEVKAVVVQNKNLASPSSSPEPALEKAVEAETPEMLSMPAHPEQREQTTPPLAVETEEDDTQGHLWQVTVPETSGEPSFAGPLGMETLAANHLATVEAQAYVPEHGFDENTINTKPAPIDVETSMSSSVQLGSAENEPFQLVPEPGSHVETETPSGGATLTIGQIDLKIVPPPKPVPHQNTPRPAPATKQRHGKGLSTSSQMRRAGLRRL